MRCSTEARMPTTRLIVALVAALLPACGPAHDSLSAEADDLARELRASSGGLTVTLETRVDRRGRGDTLRWVARGSASADLEAVFAWVPDDAYGAATLTGARTFEVAVGAGSELNTVLSGLPLFVDLKRKGAPKVTARVDFAPRFASIKGSTRLSLQAAVAPVAIGEELVYRASLRAPEGAGVTLDGVARGKLVAARRSPRDWSLDARFDGLRPLLAELDAAAPLVELVATETGGARRSKTGTLAVTVSALALTTGDAAERWPTGRCSAVVRACLNDVPPGQQDFAHCGTYREVMACGAPNQVPTLLPSPDDRSALDAALASVRAQLPEGASADAAVYVVDARRPPDVALVARAWMDQEGPEEAEAKGALTEAAVRALLDELGAAALLPAARAVVHQTSFRGFRVDSAGPGGATARHVLLHFPTAARLVTLTLTTP
jgi:hypothetical protein